MAFGGNGEPGSVTVQRCENIVAVQECIYVEISWAALIESVVLGDGGRRHLATLQALVKAGAK